MERAIMEMVCSDHELPEGKNVLYRSQTAVTRSPQCAGCLHTDPDIDVICNGNQYPSFLG